MSRAVKNVEAVHAWNLGSTYTGLAAGILKDLRRYTSAGAEATASESVTVSEIGTSGVYLARYVPTQSELYKLHLTEPTNGFEIWYQDDVADTAVPGAAEVLNVWNLGTTGLAGSITKTLKRYQYLSGTPLELSASETVTVTEIGTSGVYLAKYSPVHLGQLYQLKLAETTTGFEVWFENSVLGTSVLHAYCGEQDVEALTQRGDYIATSQPTEAELHGFMVARAAAVYSWMAGEVGIAAPGPRGYATTIDKSTDRGRALDAACRHANALGAAADALRAAGGAVSPLRIEYIAELEELFMAWRERLQVLVRVYADSAGSIYVARTHYDEGRVTRSSFTSQTEPGFVFDSSTKW